MSAIPATFRAFVAEKVAGSDPARVERGVREFHEADLPPGEVEIRVAWSSVNYKDGLATRADGKVARISPLIPGIDLAGVVVSSADGAIPVGDGGARPRLRPGCRPPRRLRRVPARAGRLGRAAGARASRRATRWRSARPASRPAMSVVALEDRGLSPDDGPVLVTGASGGVGGTALAILADRGYEVWAATGKTDEAARLRAMGAAGILTRDEVTGEGRPLESERWAGAVDAVGAATLPYVLRTLRTGAAVAASGQRRRGRAHDDGLPVHPARRRPARDGFGDDADRAAAGIVGSAGDRPAAARPRRPRDGGHAGHARAGARRDPRRVCARSLDRPGGGLARAPDAQSSSPRSCSRARSSGRRMSSAGCSGNGVCGRPRRASSRRHGRAGPASPAPRSPSPANPRSRGRRGRHGPARPPPGPAPRRDRRSPASRADSRRRTMGPRRSPAGRPRTGRPSPARR